MTPSVLKFAKAVDTDLASAATLAGATLRIFNLDAEDTERAVSTMTMGCNASALSFEYLNTAMSIVGRLLILSDSRSRKRPPFGGFGKQRFRRFIGSDGNT